MSDYLKNDEKISKYKAIRLIINFYRKFHCTMEEATYQHNCFTIYKKKKKKI